MKGKYWITLEGNDGFKYDMKCVDFKLSDNCEFIYVHFSEKKVGTYRLDLYKSWVIEEL